MRDGLEGEACDSAYARRPILKGGGDDREGAAPDGDGSLRWLSVEVGSGGPCFDSGEFSKQ